MDLRGKNNFLLAEKALGGSSIIDNLEKTGIDFEDSGVPCYEVRFFKS